MARITPPCYVIINDPDAGISKILCEDDINLDDRLYYYLIGRDAKKLDDNHWAYLNRLENVCSVSIISY